jgi:hypothetical protein
MGDKDVKKRWDRKWKAPNAGYRMVLSASAGSAKDVFNILSHW